MENMTLLKNHIKERIKNNYLDIKKQSGYYRLYTFILNRVTDLETLFFPVSGTLKNVKEHLENRKINYSNFWNAAHLDLQPNEYSSIANEIKNTLKKLPQQELDLLLIECLKELKNEGLFANEIPEFAIYIQNPNQNCNIEEKSFKSINGTSYWNAFKAREMDIDFSLTNLLIERYNLR